MPVYINSPFTEKVIVHAMERRGMKTKAQAAEALIHERAMQLGYVDGAIDDAASPDSARDGNAQSSVRDRTLPTSAPGAGADSPAGGPLTVPPQD